MDWLDSVEHVTPEELAALAETLRASAEQPSGSAERAARDQVVLRYDLLGASRTTRSSYPAIELAHDRYAQRLGMLLERLTRMEVAVEARPPTVIRLGEFRDRLPDPAGLVLAELRGLRTSCLLAAEPQLLIHVLDLLAGGNGGCDEELVEQLAERGLTSAEKKLAVRFASIVGDALGGAWADIADISMVPSRAETDPRHALFLERTERVLALPVQMDWGDVSAQLQLLVPMSALRPIEKRIARRVIDPPPMNKDGWKPELLDHLGQVQVLLSVELGTIGLTPRKLGKLEIGQVLRVDADQESILDIRVEGKPKFAGRAVVVRGNLGVHITHGGHPGRAQANLVPTENSELAGGPS